MLGPLVAFLLLSFAPGAFDAIFLVSFCFALIGLGVLMLFVEDRATGVELPLVETHSIDDQVTWLDNERLLYAFDKDIWVVDADGGGAPARFWPKPIRLPWCARAYASGLSRAVIAIEC